MKKILVVMLVIAGVSVFVGSADAYSHTATVRRVIDGDTIELTNGRRVRYIGIDTPEVGGSGLAGCYASQATRRNRTLVEGKRVQLVSDTNDRDQYGRLLRYVSVGGRSVNLELLQGGYARAVYIRPNIDRYPEYRAAHDAARAAHRGLWSACY